MKNIKAKSAILLTFIILGMALPSCKKSFLDIQPKGKVIASDLIDYDHLLNNAVIVNTNTDAQIPMGDDAIATEPFFSGAPLRTQRLFRWDAVIYDPNQDANEVTPYMNQIYIFNKIINEVMQAQTGTDLQKKAVYEEAKAQRAFNNFMLVNYFGKPYNAATAATDPGFVLVTTADVTKTNYTRATVQETYNSIVNDLTEAIPFINPAQTSNVRMCKAAAEALLGKVYVFMGKYDLALPLLNAALADVPSTLNSQLYDYNVVMAPFGPWSYDPVGSQTDYILSMPTIWNNQESLYARQLISDWNWNVSDILIAPSAMNLFGAADVRRNFFSPQSTGGGLIPNGLMRLTGPIGTAIGVTMPDIYLLQAECKARTGDLRGAVASLLTLRKNRMPATDAAQISYTDQNSLVKFVIDERRREFVLKGYRWFDMRRLANDPLFSSATYTHTIIPATGNNVTYTLTPARMTMRIPAKIMLQNPGMVNNP